MSGFTDVDQAADPRSFVRCLEKASQAGRFFAAVTGFLVAGKKP